eukprot:1303491-Amphidinium_carterae.1
MEILAHACEIGYHNRLHESDFQVMEVMAHQAAEDLMMEIISLRICSGLDVQNLEQAPRRIRRIEETSTITVTEVSQLLKHLKANKAIPNVVPTDVYTSAYEVFAPTLTTHLQQLFDTSMIPTIYQGSTIVAVPKKQSTGVHLHEHRPIQLQRLKRKIYEIYGRCLYTHAAKTVIRPPRTQRCVGDAPGIDTPLLALEQLMAHCTDNHLSLSLTFVNLCSAFDNVVHDLLFPPSTTFHKETHSTRWPRHTFSSTQLQIPPQLLTTLRAWLTSWMITQHDWRRAQSQLIMPACDAFGKHEVMSSAKVDKSLKRQLKQRAMDDDD